MLLLIDNYDSFTYNLFHYLGELGAEVVVKRNDEITAGRGAGAEAAKASCCRPAPAPRTRPASAWTLIKQADGRMPILGVCLGHQAIGQVYGGRIVRAPEPMHGKLSPHPSHRQERVPRPEQ